MGAGTPMSTAASIQKSMRHEKTTSSALSMGHGLMMCVCKEKVEKRRKEEEESFFN